MRVPLVMADDFLCDRKNNSDFIGGGEFSVVYIALKWEKMKEV